jgi:exo-1,4-beta-D-glucosaminidase
MKYLRLSVKLQATFAGLLLFLATCCLSENLKAQNNHNELILDKNWYIQSETKVPDKGEVISSETYKPEGWIPATVPTTVLGALINNGTYKDPYYSRNLESIPLEQFKNAWWYRKDFEVSNLASFTSAILSFDGINYYANIWVNGKKIASADSIKGAFKTFCFNIINYLHKGKNSIAVQVLPPQKGDFAMGFVDWTPRPNDENMGIFRPVKIKFSGDVSITNLFIKSKIELSSLKQATLTIEANITNNTSKTIKTTIKAKIENINIDQKIDLQPFESRKVIFSPENYPTLNLKNPRLWWPYTMGEPNLYSLSVNCLVKGKETDEQNITFGIREVSDYLTKEGYRGYKVNGKVIQIRGGGWTDDLFLREDGKNLEAQVQYTKLMNLNTIRLEGFWGSSQKLYDLADKYGILLMAGWSCQWEWEEYVGKTADDFGAVSTPDDTRLIAESLKDQIIMFRNHPSIFVWVYGSDKLPRPALEKEYINILKNYDPTRPSLGACSNKTSEISGNTGVKMNGPYDYVTPNYWYENKTLGGAFGFNTETGPGPQVPPLESLEKMMPPDSIWPINTLWNYHSGRNSFKDIDRYVNALNHRYGSSTNINEFVTKAQLVNYEAIRAMFEAFAVNKNHATGIIQWMLNASWPKLYWQLYDYYLTPNGAFYGTQTACKPLNIIYNYGDRNIYVSNDWYKKQENLTAVIKVFNLDSKILLSKEIKFEIGENASNKIFDIPEIKNISPVYFVDLSIKSSDGKTISKNFYWLSSKKDILDEEKSEWYYTPNKDFADYTALRNLPKTTVKVDTQFQKQGDILTIKVKLKNSSNSIAFFINTELKGKKSGKLILPVFWNDNYISLLPGEERELQTVTSESDLKGDEPVIKVSGWNLPN